MADPQTIGDLFGAPAETKQPTAGDLFKPSVDTGDPGVDVGAAHSYAQKLIEDSLPQTPTRATLTSTALPGTVADTASRWGDEISDQMGSLELPFADLAKKGAGKAYQAASIVQEKYPGFLGQAIASPTRSTAHMLDVMGGGVPASEGVREAVGSLSHQSLQDIPVVGNPVDRVLSSPVGRAVMDMGGSLINADNLPFIAAGPALSAAKIESALIAMGFGTSIAASAPESYNRIREASANGDWRGVAYESTTLAGKAAMAVVLLGHAGSNLWEQVDAARPITQKDLAAYIEGAKQTIRETMSKPPGDSATEKPVETLDQAAKKVASEPGPAPVNPEAPGAEAVTPKVSGEEQPTVGDLFKQEAPEPGLTGDNWEPSALYEKAAAGDDTGWNEFPESVRKAAAEEYGIPVNSEGMPIQHGGYIDTTVVKPEKQLAEKSGPEAPPVGTPIDVEGKTVPAAGVSSETVPGNEGEPVTRNNKADPQFQQAVKEKLPENLFSALDELQGQFKNTSKIDLQLSDDAQVSSTQPNGKGGWTITLAQDSHDPASLLHEFYHVLQGVGELPKDFVFDNNGIAAHYLDTRAPGPTAEGDTWIDKAMGKLPRVLRELVDSRFASEGNGRGVLGSLLSDSKVGYEAFMTRTQGKVRDYMEKFRTVDPREDPLVGWADLAQQGKFDEIPDPIAREVFRGVRAIYDEMGIQNKKWNPDMEHIDGYLSRIWKVLPTADAQLRKEMQYDQKTGKPLGGYKTWNLQREFQYMQRGVEMGGIPLTTNPMDLSSMYYYDSLKDITGRKALLALQERGLASTTAEPGFMTINDRLTHGLYFDPFYGGMLENFLSYDHVKNNAWGRGFLSYKNTVTQMELGLSLFHPAFIANEATSSMLGNGITRLWNTGVNWLAARASGMQEEKLASNVEINAKLDKVFFRDLGMSATGLAHPATSGAAANLYTMGSRLRQYGEASRAGTMPEAAVDWLKTDAGQGLTKWLQSYGIESALDALKLAQKSGLDIGQNTDYKTNTYNSWRESIEKNDVVGSMLKAAPAMTELFARPFFDHFIPSVKAAHFIADFAARLETYKYDLTRTHDGIARESVRATDNRFGEMGFDKLFWDNTFKSAAQGVFRSVTWKLGTARGYSDAFVNQMRILAGSYEDSSQLLRGRLSPDMAWAMSAWVTAVAQGSVAYYAFNGKWPKDYIDMLFPPVGGHDSTGHQMRLAAPGYQNEALSMSNDPLKWAASSLASPVSKVGADLLRGKNYWGEEVNLQNPTSVLKDLVPYPFSMESLARMQQNDASPMAMAYNQMGFKVVPQSAHIPGFVPGVGGQGPHTEGERLIEDAYHQGQAFSPEKSEHYEGRHMISQAKTDYRYGPDQSDEGHQQQIDKIKAQKDVTPGSQKKAIDELTDKKGKGGDAYDRMLFSREYLPWPKMAEIAKNLPPNEVKRFGPKILDLWQKANSGRAKGQGVAENERPEIEKQMNALRAKLGVQ